jgi:hypothetical protein
MPLLPVEAADMEKIGLIFNWMRKGEPLDFRDGKRIVYYRGGRGFYADALLQVFPGSFGNKDKMPVVIEILQSFFLKPAPYLAFFIFELAVIKTIMNSVEKRIAA